jgi:DNA invertase Pin-like site-specific DNA recombinase
MQSYIAYYRVSTQKQGQSGLGLDAQLTAVKNLVAERAGTVIASYQEIEKGRRKDRPELLKALAHAKRSKAILVVAKLDRLSRNVHFLTALMEAGVEFVCCDNPHATKLMLHMLVAFAQHEAEMISLRTREALAARKARGLPLGSHDSRCRSIEQIERAGMKGQQLGSAANSRKAREAYADLVPVMQSLRTDGASLREIAKRLNLLNQTTRTGKPWNHVQVKLVLDRAA